MKLPANVREQFRRHGRDGGLARAAHLPARARKAIASRAASVRWIRARFGSRSFKTLGLPGGDIVDTGLADLATGKLTLESLLVSLAAPRLRREGIPVGPGHDHPEENLYNLLAGNAEDLAHARYSAYLRIMVSFADACPLARLNGDRLAP